MSNGENLYLWVRQWRLLHRPLHGGTLQVAHRVLYRLSESRLVATWSLGVLGAMYNVVDTSRMTLSAGPARSCRSLANSSWRFGWDVRRCVPSWLGFASSCFASAVTRFRGLVSRSFAYLAGDWARRVLVVCFGCVFSIVRLRMYVFWVQFLL
jgi:hypothetical protein